MPLTVKLSEEVGLWGLLEKVPKRSVEVAEWDGLSRVELDTKGVREVVRVKVAPAVRDPAAALKEPLAVRVPVGEGETDLLVSAEGDDWGEAEALEESFGELDAEGEGETLTVTHELNPALVENWELAVAPLTVCITDGGVVEVTVNKVVKVAPPGVPLGERVTCEVKVPVAVTEVVLVENKVGKEERVGPGERDTQKDGKTERVAGTKVPVNKKDVLVCGVPLGQRLGDVVEDCEKV